MRKEIILSDIGVLGGIAGIIIALLPFFSSIDRNLYSTVLPILFGVIGFILVLKVKKELNDEIVKAGLVMNPVSILLGIINFFLLI